MRRIILFLLLLQICLLPVCTFAQTVKIIALEGQVQVKKQTRAKWEDAKINLILNKNAEIKTQKNSTCTLAFDERLKNILVVKENSYVRIEELIPVNIMLDKGKAFCFVNDINRVVKFQIRTPTAIAAARGTEWLTEFEQDKTRVVCFEDSVLVQGLDEKGNVTSEKEISDGLGIEVDLGGLLGEVFVSSVEDLKEWSEIKADTEEIITQMEPSRTEEISPGIISIEKSISEEKTGISVEEGITGVEVKEIDNIREEAALEDIKQEQRTEYRETDIEQGGFKTEPPPEEPPQGGGEQPGSGGGEQPGSGGITNP